MVVSDRFRFIGQLSGLPKRVPALPPRHWAILRSGVPLILALALGNLAWQWSASEALQSWRRGHRPSGALWAATLQANGFQEIHDSKQLSRLVRSLPTLSEQDGTWLAPGAAASSAPLWVARAGDPIRIFTRDPAGPLPQTGFWRPLGEGWPALEGFIEACEASRQSPVKSPKIKAKPAVRDPRELVF